MTRYLSCAETAKLIRIQLKRKFSDTKFSVRSSTYAGGASINISYKDGYALKEVEAVAKSFEGAGFDGMIDLKYTKSHWLLYNGDVVLAKDEGTTDAGGVYPSNENNKPSPDAEAVHFGADFVFVEREISKEIEQDVAKTVAKDQGIDYNGDLNERSDSLGGSGTFHNFLWRFLQDKDLRNYKETKHKDGLQTGHIEEFWEVISHSKNKTMTYLKEDEWGRKVFLDEDKKIWKKVDGIFHSTTPEGEPNCPIKKEIKITEVVA